MDDLFRLWGMKKQAEKDAVIRHVATIQAFMKDNTLESPADSVEALREILLQNEPEAIKLTKEIGVLQAEMNRLGAEVSRVSMMTAKFTPRMVQLDMFAEQRNEWQQRLSANQTAQLQMKLEKEKLEKKRETFLLDVLNDILS